MNEKTYEQTFFRKPIKNTKLLILNDGSKSNVEKVINELEKELTGLLLSNMFGVSVGRSSENIIHLRLIL